MSVSTNSSETTQRNQNSRFSNLSIQDLYFWRNFRKSQGKKNAIRVVLPNHTIPEDAESSANPNILYKNNRIQTSKYTLWSFLPKNLFEQFHRFANLYFLSIIVMNWVPQINAFGKEISMIPIIFVLTVIAIKDLFEDRRRHKSDQRINNNTCRIFSKKENRYVKTPWKDLLVGDIVRLSCNEVIPADILLLSSSHEKGLCFLETSNLDGESNLKQRLVVRGFSARTKPFHPTNFQSRIDCDPPNNKIYKFHGSISQSNQEKISVSKENVILRDCILKNTDFVEGIVVYAGHETKTMLNNDGPRYKRSNLEKLMNWDVMWCVVILFILCSVGAIGSSLWLSSFDNSTIVPYIPDKLSPKFDPSLEGFLAFLTFIIIFQIMIPLSLYVSIEIVKLGQVYFIHEDIELYDEKSNKRIECRALNIPEELGQIQYVFSDKTGTLTENHMIFRRCTIGGVDYNHHHPSVADVQEDNSKKAKSKSDTILILNPALQDALVKMEAQLLAAKVITPSAPSTPISQHKLINTQFSLSPDSQNIQDFFLIMALCNTVVVSNHPHKDTMNLSGFYSEDNAPGPSTDSSDRISLKPITSQETTDSSLKDNISATSSPISNSRPSHLDLPFLQDRASTPSTPSEKKPIFEAESPDELALVDCAFRYNCRLLCRTFETAVLALPGEGIVEYKILHVLPFDSFRKRMSVIVECPLTKEKILYCKGADSAILTQLAPITDPDAKDNLIKTQYNFNNYCKKGLRILCMAKKIIKEEEYREWLVNHKEAELAFENQEKKLLQSACAMETNLELVGATGIEDRLQEGVPECIQALRNAGIVVWVMTGDKQETAVNIAYSCKLFSYDMEIITINARSKEATESTIKFHLNQISRDLEIPVQKSPSKIWSSLKFWKWRKVKKDMKSPRFLSYSSTRKSKRALVIDGRTLTFALDPSLEKKFLELTLHCGAVLGCRVTPLQKASVVKLVKDNLEVKTLAIGDGANDVSMIQTAAVGIGISGQEGMQAVMASDFALARFHYLERLLLVHGRWCYERLSTMVLYFFYKNAGLIFVLFWYQIYCGFSGMVAIDQLYLMFYNFVFTSVPPLICGVYDQDASDDLLLCNPRLYKLGRDSQVYKTYSFWLNILDAFYQSIIIFFVCYFTYDDSATGIWEFGTTLTTSCIFVQLLHLSLETKSWTWIHIISLILSILSYFAFGLTYNAACKECYRLPYGSPFWVMESVIMNATFWLCVLLTVVIALLPRFVVKVLSTTLAPCDLVKIRLLKRNIELTTSWSRQSSNSSVFFPATANQEFISTIEPLNEKKNSRRIRKNPAQLKNYVVA